MELTAGQIYIVGLIASGLAIVLRLLVAKFANFELSKFWMTIIVGLLSGVLAVVFNLPTLPVYVDFWQFVGEWLAVAGTYVGSATIIYNLILDKVLDAVGLQVERLVSG